MTGSEYLNVFKGPDSVRNYFDPGQSPPLPLVEIPDSLNPYRQDGVRIYAKMMTMHPATNVKVMPAMNLLENGVQPGKTKTIVESSSGSTVISMAMVARAFHGIDDVHAYLSNKTSETKLRMMQFFGLNVTLFGGPAQPTPVDERGGIRSAARKDAESESVCSPNQYINDDYFSNLGPEKFSALRNERLRNVDLYRYDDAWELNSLSALSSYYTIHPLGTHDTVLSLADQIDKALTPLANTQVLDFRCSSDYEAFHLPNSVNMPLETLRDGPSSGSPFANPADECAMLEELWLELESLFNVKDKNGNRNASAEALMSILRGKRVLTLCYDGDSARVANSVLRAKGVEAESVRGGYGALAKLQMPCNDTCEIVSVPVSIEA
ncbi:Cysteine synthase a [Fusarium acuminatum]|uniref:Cysteine synthase a n=1 Tax=Fusarium acuminatum TaxID=5515 RepID=A0ABZ2WTM5_9HYPO